MKRIGPQMRRAQEIVKANPGCCILDVAKQIAPHGTGIKYGYSAVHRAIKAGLISAVKKEGNVYSLTANK